MRSEEKNPTGWKWSGFFPKWEWFWCGDIYKHRCQQIFEMWTWKWLFWQLKYTVINVGETLCLFADPTEQVTALRNNRPKMANLIYRNILIIQRNSDTYHCKITSWYYKSHWVDIKVIVVRKQPKSVNKWIACELTSGIFTKAVENGRHTLFSIALSAYDSQLLLYLDYWYEAI